MLLALSEIIRRSGHSDLEFHRIAYWYCFQRDNDLRPDVEDFQKKGKIAPYVIRYINHLEGKSCGL